MGIGKKCRSLFDGIAVSEFKKKIIELYEEYKKYKK